MSILTVICSSTVLNGLFYLVSLGWGTTVQQIERNVLTNVMIVGGSLYLLQLAKNYSQYDQSIFPSLFDFALLLEYMVLFYINIRNLKKEIKKLQTIVYSEENLIPQTMRPSMLLKIKQLKIFFGVITVFFTSQGLYQLYYACASATGSQD